MTTFTPQYALTLYKLPSEDPTESTVLTPPSTAPHQNVFQITTMKNLAGWFPYLQQIRGRRGRIDDQTRRLDIGSLTIDMLDPMITVGGSNATRWTTAFFGDAKGRFRGKHKALLQESLDGGVTWNAFWTGRVVKRHLTSANTVSLELRDASDDLKMMAFVGEPHNSITYAGLTSVMPVGVIRSAFGTLQPVAPLTGIASSLAASSVAFLPNLRAISLDAASQARDENVITQNLLATCPPNQIVGAPASPFGENIRIAWSVPVITGRCRARLKHLTGPYTGQTGDYQVGGLSVGKGKNNRQILTSFMLQAVDPSDRFYLPIMSDGTSVEFTMYVDTQIGDKAALLINDVDPAQFVQDLCDGKFGYYYRPPETLPALPSLFSYTPGDSLAAATFSRASTATYLDANGVMQTAASGVVRDAHYINGARSLLLEGARTNLVLNSSIASATNWNSDATTFSFNSQTAPNGNQEAALITCTTANQRHIFYPNAVAAGSNVQVTWSIFVRPAGWSIVQINLQNGTNNNVFANIDLSTNTIGLTGAGTSGVFDRFQVTPYGNGWYRLELTGHIGAATVFGTIGMAPTISSGFDPAWVPVGTESIQIWGGQMETAPFASSYIVTTTGTVTRSADSLVFPFTANMQSMTTYARMRDLGTSISSGTNMGIVNVGNYTGSAASHLVSYAGGAGNFGCEFNNNIGGNVNDGITVAGTYQRDIEVRNALTGGGVPNIGVAISGGAEVVGGNVTGTTVPNAPFTNQQLSLNVYSTNGFAAFYRVVVVAGVFSMTALRGGVKSYGDVKKTVPCANSAAFLNTRPLLRAVIKKAMKVIDFIEECLLEQLNWAIYMNKLGQLTLVDMTLPSTFAGLPTIVDTDTQATSATWDHDTETAITRVDFTHYIDQPITQSQLTPTDGSTPKLDDSGVVQEYNAPLLVLNVGSSDFDDNSKQIDATIFRAMQGEVENGQDKFKLHENYLAGLAAQLRMPYGWGAATLPLPCRRTATINGLTQGSLALLNVSWVPDPVTNRRGAIRVVRVLEISEDNEIANLTLLDMGVNATVSSPVLGPLALETSNGYSGVILPITLDAALDQVECRYAITATSVGTIPVDGSPLWTFGFLAPGSMSGIAYQSGNATLRVTAPGQRCWVQIRSVPTSSEPHFPSAWVSPNSGNAYIDLTAVPTPSAISFSNITAHTARASFTPGASDLQTRVQLTLPGIFDSYTRADSASTLSSAEIFGQTYTYPAGGTFGITSGLAKLVSGTGNFVAVVPGCADGTLTCSITMSPTASRSNVGLAFRLSSSSNYLLLSMGTASVNSIRLWKNAGGGFSSLQEVTPSGLIVAGGTYAVSVVLNGANIGVLVNGTQYLNYTLTTAEQATLLTPVNVGLFISADGTDDDGGSRWDNLVFTPKGLSSYIGSATSTFATLMPGSTYVDISDMDANSTYLVTLQHLLGTNMASPALFGFVSTTASGTAAAATGGLTVVH